jgi:hypothetical protein
MKFGNVFMKLCEHISRATQLMFKKKFMEMEINEQDLMTTFFNLGIISRHVKSIRCN